MGRENTCKAVPNHGVAGQVRTACSKCGTIWDNNVNGICPKCKRRIKPSLFSNKFCR